MLAQIAIDPLARGQIIIAGATDGNGALADFSNKAGVASATYLTALGTRVRSMDQTGTAYLYSGTSFATPVIAGAAALLAQAFPNLSGAQIVALLLRTATDLGAAGVDPVFGHGELNLSRAFAPQGSTTLANTSVGVSLTGNATLGAAMGDAAGSASASIRDGYGRDYAVDLSGTIARTTPSYALGQALQIGSRSMGARVGRASLALAIADGVAVPQRLLLDRADAGRARLLAGAVALGLGKTTRLGIGIGRGSDGLMPTSIDAATPAFLIGDRSLDRAPLAAFALRQSMGGIGLTVAAENGELRLWQAGATGPHSNGWQRYGYSQTALGLDARHGRFALATRLTRLHEKATILGGRFDAALGGGGATSWFADAEAMVDFGSGWRLIGALRHGLTDADSGALRTASRLSSRALSASVIKTGIFGRDSLALRYAEPLRVTGGALMLTLPGTAIQALSLTPQGHERDLEAAYMRPLGGGFVTLNAYRRVQPGHWVNAPTETGAALRWSSEF